MTPIRLTIFVSDLTDVMALYDRIQIWRSTDGETYEEITAAAAVAATLLGTEVGPFSLNGVVFELAVDGAPTQTLTFLCTDLIDIADVVAEVEAEFTGLTAADESGHLRITSATTGTGSSLLIVGGTALEPLGFEEEEFDSGESVRISLVPATPSYVFIDQNGDTAYSYKTRYYNSVLQTFSEFSDPVTGEVVSIVPSADLIKAYCILANPDGSPVSATRISIYSVYRPPLLVAEVAVLGREVEMTTDELGYAEIMLVKGAVVDVTLVGTGLTRRITVPATGTEFNIFEAVAAADDIFQIQTPVIPEAVRRAGP